MSDDAPLLEVEHLSVTYPGELGPVHAIDDVSFAVTGHEVLGCVEGRVVSFSGQCFSGATSRPPSEALEEWGRSWSIINRRRSVCSGVSIVNGSVFPKVCRCFSAMADSATLSASL